MLLPFSIRLQPGRPLHDQIVFAVTRAIVRGQLQAGDGFPSVRTLSQELKINPNTAQRVVATLIGRNLLDVRPGVGTIVAERRPADSSAGRAVLNDHVDRLVVEAKRLGLNLGDVLDLIRREWK